MLLPYFLLIKSLLIYLIHIKPAYRAIYGDLI